MLGISTRTIQYRLKQYAQEREEAAAGTKEEGPMFRIGYDFGVTEAAELRGRLVELGARVPLRGRERPAVCPLLDAG